MRKLLLLILLIPVLSWADCPGKDRPEAVKETFWGGFEVDDEANRQWDTTHCESHRCIALGRFDANCMCENQGGLEFERIDKETGNIHRKCVNGSTVIAGYCEQGSDGSFHDLHFCKEPITQTPTPPATPDPTPKVTIDDAKSQCSDIGFKKGTERFGECVLELMQ